MSIFEPGPRGEWGWNLTPGRFARALAAAGVLAAIDAKRMSAKLKSPELMPFSAAELLRALLASLLKAESPLLQWETPLDENRQPPNWMPAPEVLEEIWSQAFELRDKRFRERVAIDGQGRTRSEPPRTGARLGLPADFELLEDAIKTLVNPDTRIESLSALITRNKPGPEWNWPVKLRVLGMPGVDQSVLTAFVDAIPKTRPWTTEHLTVLPESSRDRADFTLLFDDTGEANDAFFDIPEGSVNADCLIVATPTPKSMGTPARALAMLGRLKATGLVLQPGLTAGAVSTVSWMIEFVRELSHTLTVDVAAIRAAAKTEVSLPTMRLSKALLTNAHVSQRQETILSQLERAGRFDAAIQISHPTLQALGVDATVNARALAEALRKRLTPLDFDRESEGASVIASLALALPIAQYPIGLEFGRSSSRPSALPSYTHVDELPPESRESTFPEGMRFLQAQLVRVQRTRLVEKFKALARHGHCFVRIRIGDADGAWPGFGNATFPAHLLPTPKPDGWTLQVYLFTNSGENAQNTSLFLPIEGSSDPVEFKCLVGDGSMPFKARVVVAYANRVLQSAWLEAPVKPEFGRVRGSFARGLEMVVKQNLTDLEDRSEFGAFVVVNHSLTNGPGVVIASGPSAVLRTPPDLDETIDYIDEELSKVSVNSDQYDGGLESKAVVRLLRNLAQHGRELFEAIVHDQRVDQALIDAERVQVVAADAWARLPIEFFYDQPAPEQNAPLCPGAARCLSGEMATAPAPCNDACPAAGSTAKVVCPRGFWGLRKVIEWHRHSGDRAHDGDFRLQSEPDTHRKSIKAFQSVLFAHSDRVDAHYAQASADVLKALKNASSNAYAASDWDLWRMGISNHSPLLMVMLPHNETSSNMLQELSIGPGTLAPHRLLISSISDEYVMGPETAPGAIVMLLGCETGASKISYLNYVPKFRRYGASVVISTGAVVLGRQISPISVRLIKELQAAVASGPAPLGHVMLRLRRAVLAEGFPIVLALSASGDADWLLE